MGARWNVKQTQLAANAKGRLFGTQGNVVMVAACRRAHPAAIGAGAQDIEHVEALLPTADARADVPVGFAGLVA